MMRRGLAMLVAGRGCAGQLSGLRALSKLRKTSVVYTLQCFAVLLLSSMGDVVGGL